MRKRRTPSEPYEGCQDLPGPRDQPASAFAAILALLVRRVPGARGAALVDRDGETVDYAGEAEPYAVRIAAAHWRIVLEDVRRLASFSKASALAIRAQRASYRIQLLPGGYAVVLLLKRGAGLEGGERALDACSRLLGAEAGWAPLPPPGWYAVNVQSDPGGRPHAVDGAARCEHLEILGVCEGGASGLRRRERGFRVRFESGAEATLIREAGGLWYADEPLHALSSKTWKRPGAAASAQEGWSRPRNSLTGGRL